MTTELKCNVTFLGPVHDKFGVHRSCESVDIPFFVFHVTTWSMCHVTLWVRYPYHPTKFGAHRAGESEDIMFFICHVTLRYRGHVTTCLVCHMTLWVGSPDPNSPHC